jgi:hypothetical protein
MKENNKMFAEELFAYVMKPERLFRLCNSYDIELVQLVDICWSV